LRKAGHEAVVYNELLKQYAWLNDDVIARLEVFIHDNDIDILLSIHFIMNVALVACRDHMKYVSLLWDAPFVEVYNPLAKLDEIYISTFDKLDRQRFLDFGVKNVIYQPLCVNAALFEAWNEEIQKTLEGDYFHDISLIGQLYDENAYDRIADKFPTNVRDFFDNIFEEAAFKWDGINRTTNLIVAGKIVVVAGYGWCGKGTAMRAKGLGARVIVTEIDPIKAIEAVMDGFDVMPMKEAAKVGDFFVTVTGCDKVIDEEDFALMKDGAILCNAGHFDCEIDMARLREIAVETREQRKNIMGYKLPTGQWIFVLAEGRLVNLAAGDGHPAEIMDMSFAIQALSAKYLVEHGGELNEKLIDVPREVDMDVAKRKLSFLGKEIDVLTEEQEKYLNSYIV
jgi:hypothetical protein